MTSPSQRPPAGASFGALSPAARALLARQGGGGARIPRRADPARAPLSFAQQRLWLLDRLEPDNTAYVRPKAFRIGGSLDVPALRRALGELAARHETLRSAVALGEGGPYVRVLPAAGVPLPVVDASHGDDDSALRARLVAETRTPFDLARGPFLRATLLRLAAGDHTLLLTLHHIASDAWSDGVLLRELGALYGAFARGEPSPLAEPRIQYGDYAAWQRERFTADRLAHDTAYWTGALAGAPPVLELPTDFPRPAARGTAAARASLLLPAALAGAIAALGRSEQATPFMVMLAAWQTILARYARRDDVVVGVPIAGRTRTETEEVVGLFVNTLPLRARVSPAASFRELLAQVRRTTLDGYAHQELPFDRVVEALRPPRSASHSPVVQAIFNFRSAPPATLEMPGLRVRAVPAPELSVVTDLDLDVVAERDGLRCSLDFSTELFAPATSERMLGGFRTLLERAVTAPDTAVGTLPLMDPLERERVLVAWNRTGGGYPLERCAHGLVAEQAARTPDAVAIVSADGSRTLGYAELVARARSLAGVLRAAGVVRGARVAVCLDRSPELLVALFAVLEAGAAYVPLDPQYPRARLELILGDAGIAALVTARELAGRVPHGAGLPVVYTDDPSAAGDAAPAARGTGELSPDDVAYVIYTSGSTGRPKGVEVTHRGLANLGRAAAEVYDFSAADRVVQFATISFDTAAEEIYTTLYTGGALVLRPAGPPPATRDFLAWCAARDATVLILPTAYWHELAAALAGDPSLALPPRLRAVIVGGERMLPERVALWRRAMAARRGAPGAAARLFNGYGPTEATVTATVHELPAAGDDDRRVPVPIGRPLANVRAYVLDAGREPTPVGVPGELYLGGVGVARGYLHRPDLTAERFLADPVVPGGRVYRTGDLARFLPDGSLEYLGRGDDTVKVRGFRVEPGEVEATLARHPAVRDCAVVAREDGPAGEARLVAYVVPEAGAAELAGPGALPDAFRETLRAHLREHLPEYYLPAAFVALAALPMTPNDKVDRGALPAPQASAGGAGVDGREPRTHLERQVARLWGELLGVPAVARDDDFFDLGGHSLIAVAMADQLTRLFGAGPWLAALLEEPTVAHLARVLDERRGEPASPVFRAQQGEPGAPALFFLHGDFDGGGLYTRALARHLGPSQPLYVVSPALPGGPDTVEAMAACLLPLVREAQPRGPYLLAGYCNGGLVAYEMARRLTAAGERVELVAVVDASARNVVLARVHGALTAACRAAGLDDRRRDALFVHWRDSLLRVAPAGGAAAGWAAWLGAFSRGAARVARRRLAPRRAVPAATAAPPPPAPVPTSTGAGARREAERDEFYGRVMSAYVPKPYAGRVTLVAASQWAVRHAADATASWASCAAGVDVREVGATHGELITSHVGALATTLRAAIAATRAAT